MKKIILITLLFSCLFSFGKCQKKNCKKKSVTTTQTASNANEIWMRYDDTQCANPWHFDWLVAPTTEQIVSAVRGYLEGRSVHILEMRITVDKDIISCEACTCPSGGHYFVRINKSDAGKLKELKFVEVKEPK